MKRLKGWFLRLLDLSVPEDQCPPGMNVLKYEDRCHYAITCAECIKTFNDLTYWEKIYVIILDRVGRVLL